MTELSTNLSPNIQNIEFQKRYLKHQVMRADSQSFWRQQRRITDKNVNFSFKFSPSCALVSKSQAKNTDREILSPSTVKAVNKIPRKRALKSAHTEAAMNRFWVKRWNADKKIRDSIWERSLSEMPNSLTNVRMQREGEECMWWYTFLQPL